MPAPGAPRRRTAIAAADAPVADTSAPTAAEVVAPPTRLYPPPARQAPAAPPQSALPQSALPEAAPPLSAAQPAAQSAAQPAAPPSLPAAERPATPPAGTAPPVQPTSAPAAQASQESMPLQPAAGPAVPPATPAATASAPVPPAAPVPPVTPERVSAPVSPVPPATPDRTSGPVPPAPAPMSAAPQPPAPAAAAAPLPAAPVSLLPRTAKAGAQAPATAADTAAADAAKAAATAAEAARPAAASNSPALQSAEAPALKVAATVNGDGLALRFPWSQPTAAAAYARAGSLWIVFDRRATLDLSALKTAGGPMIAAAEQVQADDATALRLKADAALNPELRLEGEAWVVDLKREELRPETPVALNAATPAGQASRFVVPLERAGHKVVLKDPEVGDTVVVVPVLAAGEGIETTRDYPLFRLLATAQGAAVESKADGLEIAATPEGLEITGPNGLFLSADARAPSSAGAQEQTDGAPATTSQPEPEPERAGTPSPVGAAAATGRLFDFAAWRHDDSPFEDVRQSLLQAAADAPEAARNEARMRLAEFYFARGFAAEALGVLRIVAESEPRYAGDPLFRAMRGVSRYLMGDYAGAAEDLSVPGLADSADAAVWRGAVAVAQGRWPDAAAAFATVGDRIPSYPPTMRTKLAEDAAETALNAGEFDAMKIYLDMAAKGAPDMAAQARAKFLLGRAAEKRGNRDEAAGLYDQAAAMGDTQVAVRATYAKVGMLLDAGKMTRPDAIKALEGLRYAWRGDAFEFDLLRRLGNLYLAESSYEQGLATLRRAVTLFPTIDGAEAVTQTMTEAFAKLYLEGAADSLPPLKALGLYQNFRELTPPGEKGDEMIRKLAERLVAVDLLDQAGELLQNQVDFRLQGETKARVGARLAAIRLLDKMPDRALSAIDSSAADNLPADLVAERRHLKARALAELGRSDDALAELKGDDGAEAETIRADILWDNRDWAGAAKVLARLASAIPPDGALGDDQSVTVLRLAVALWLANDRNDLEALRQRFTARMDNTPYHDDFRVIAAAPADDMESVQSIARRLAEVDQYEAFLAGLKQRAKDHQLANAAAN
jgi:tetratricopeptide (TPR) repeat protein